MERKRPLRQMLERVTGRKAVLLGQANPVDESRTFAIAVIGEPLARISTLKISCRQEDGTMKIFDILAGEVPNAVPGAGNLVFRAMSPLPFRPSDVTVVNDGITGVVFVRVIDDTGARIFSREGTVDQGNAMFMMTDVVFDMPSREYALTVEAGH